MYGLLVNLKIILKSMRITKRGVRKGLDEILLATGVNERNLN
jgi:hypothetical protein